MDRDILPVGKLPLSLLEKLLKTIPAGNPDVLAGPGIGIDAAVIRFGEETLVFKTDPITFTSGNISRYLVTVNANDIACMGGTPRYLLATFLLPEGKTTPANVESLFKDLENACRSSGIELVGGHTEITYGIDRAIAAGFMIGTLEGRELIRPSGAKPGNAVLLSKRIPIEAVSVIASEVPGKLGLDRKTIEEARDLLYHPGIGIQKEAAIARETGGVTAMHDPTEGGLATGLKELALAAGCGIEVERDRIPVLELAEKILPRFSIDPLGTLASGSLVVCCREESAEAILAAWRENGIEGSLIGRITPGPEMILVENGTRRLLPEFPADEIVKIFRS
ncbi:MAG TPA: AIR synthase-related protein [Deltaproteobacteria bacterium]|nr:AIR synthase-related protein [Deltaproteobacteria bacterium]HQJ08440.1 AIR synthase-related protein [Deltaproteobacteria bacterium]